MKIKAKTTVAKVTTAKPAAKANIEAPAAKKAVSNTRRVIFTVRAEAGSKVFLAGSFNDWDPTAKAMTDKKNEGLFTATLTLAPGTYQYKFVIDGTWCADPECAEWVQNDHGTLNSVKTVE